MLNSRKKQYKGEFARRCVLVSSKWDRVISLSKLGLFYREVVANLDSSVRKRKHIQWINRRLRECLIIILEKFGC